MDISGVTSIFASVPLDWIIAGTALFIFVIATMLRGTSYATALALSLPTSTILFDAIPHTAFIGTISQQFSTPIEQTILFALIEIVLFLCMYRISATFDHSASPLVALMASLAAIIVVLVTWTQISPLESLLRPGTQMQSIFGEAYRVFWLILAYLALAFARS